MCSKSAKHVASSSLAHHRVEGTQIRIVETGVGAVTCLGAALWFELRPLIPKLAFFRSAVWL